MTQNNQASSSQQWIVARPSLAMVKYWGKFEARPGQPANLAATPSVAVTLDGIETQTRVSDSDRWQVTINGQDQDPAAFEHFATTVAHYLTKGLIGPSQGGGDAPRARDLVVTPLTIESVNSFPTAAGLASSSSGFAALCGALFHHWDVDWGSEDSLRRRDMSALARQGSGSASRSVYGGFTHYGAGQQWAEPLHGPDHWPELRVIMVAVEGGAKPISSRKAMEQTRTTSPYYEAWVQDAPALANRAMEALAHKDLEALGSIMGQSYMRMFGTMFASVPPVVYWKPLSLKLIHWAARLRSDGLQVWETMDAGPQVKLFCLAHDLDQVIESLEREIDPPAFYVCRPGEGLEVVEESEGNG